MRLLFLLSVTIRWAVAWRSCCWEARPQWTVTQNCALSSALSPAQCCLSRAFHYSRKKGTKTVPCVPWPLTHRGLHTVSKLCYCALPFPLAWIFRKSFPRTVFYGPLLRGTSFESTDVPSQLLPSTVCCNWWDKDPLHPPPSQAPIPPIPYLLNPPPPAQV